MDCFPCVLLTIFIEFPLIFRRETVVLLLDESEREYFWLFSCTNPSLINNLIYGCKSFHSNLPKLSPTKKLNSAKEHFKCSINILGLSGLIRAFSGEFKKRYSGLLIIY